MSTRIYEALNGKQGNYILPFFWQHGEDEETLREYMGVIQDMGIRAVCLESRPHPDFAGPKWWEDMDVILSEARQRNMKVWILDDCHFPTGYANGAMADAKEDLQKWTVYHLMVDLAGPGRSAGRCGFPAVRTGHRFPAPSGRAVFSEKRTFMRRIVRKAG